MILVYGFDAALWLLMLIIQGIKRNIDLLPVVYQQLAITGGARIWP